MSDDDVTLQADALVTATGPFAEAGEALTPGSVIARRYRIVNLLGRGGMGAVYRAEDLRLGQQVALKFLSSGSLHSGDLRRLYSEVRIGRKVTHPNVSRIYDLIEDGPTHFLSMELVDGEDLASLHRRIGRVSIEKAAAIAHDICSGLQAIHDQGIVHRDLKPANVMLDGRGTARVTDFGLATATDTSGSAIAGTPAYMSPEQLENGPVSAQSDIYALGLVLFELFSGRRVFEASSLPALVDAHRRPKPRLSSVVEGIDPSLDELIASCLEESPDRRPATAREVQSRLPGGNRLFPGLNLSETPEPDLVAAAPVVGELRPLIAWSLLAVIILGMITSLLIDSRVTQVGRGVPHPPAVLRDRALQVLAAAGHRALTHEVASFAGTDAAARSYIQSGVKTPTEVLPFRFRQSPRPLKPLNPFVVGSLFDPPTNYPGMVDVWMNAQGHLIEYLAVPPDQAKWPPAPPLDERAWQPLFAAASLSAQNARPVPVRWNSPVAHDQRWAWDVKTPRETVHIEAAALAGEPVWYRQFQPWEKPRETRPIRPRPLHTYVFELLLLSFAPLAAWIARRNLRAGRGDRRGAMRIASLVGAISLAAELLGAEDLAVVNFSWLILRMMEAFFYASLACLAYLAAEPAIRKRWPEVLISWNRATMGRFRDPLVARDILIGGALAGLANTLSSLTSLVQPVVTADGVPFAYPGNFFALSKIQRLLAGLLSNAEFSIFIAFASLFVLWTASVLLRSTRVAGLVLVLCGVLGFNNSFFQWNERPYFVIAFSLAFALITAIQAWMLRRIGLVANLAYLLVFMPFEVWTLTLNRTMWYFWTTPVAFLLTGAISLWAFRAAMPRRTRFGSSLAFD